MISESPTLAIEAVDLGKRFGARWVFTHVHFQIESGQSVALFGRNGSGKSTLLRILSTLDSPSTGTVKILGKALEDKREIRPKIRFLAHEKQLYPTLTVLENLRLASGLRGIPDAPYGELLEKFQLARAAHRRVGELSEGMKKRVVLAKLLIGDSDLILLDEPYPALDQEARGLFHEMMAGWKSQGKTVVLASHDHERARSLADRIFFFEGMMLHEEGKGG